MSDDASKRLEELEREVVELRSPLPALAAPIRARTEGELRRRAA